ncbi:MAG: hypothetical protein C4551_00710 [Bacillota bacterium]|nr:MAG: hypothetical protein C4551_00710 [Bacillota bacterium]
MGPNPECRKRRHTRPIAAALAVLCLLALSPPVAGAADSTQAPARGEVLSISLSPVKTACDLAPGETFTFTATFRNGGNITLQASLRFMDVICNHNDFEFTEPGDAFWSAGNWLEADPREFTIQPGERRAVTISLKVPEGTPDGQYYAGYFVEAARATPAPGETVVTLGGSLGAIVYVAIGDGLERSARLVPYGYVPKPARPAEGGTGFSETLRHYWRCLVIRTRNVSWFNESRPLKVFLPLENTGQAYIQPRFTVEFWEGGSLRRTVTCEGDMIVPGQSKITEVAWPDAPAYGSFGLRIKVAYGGSEPIEVERTFRRLPVRATLGLVAMAFGLGYLMARRGRRSGRESPAAAKG